MADTVNSQITDLATVEHLSAATQDRLPRGEGMPHDQGGSHGHGAMSVREATHNGRQIRIETTYKISVDGEPIGGHVMVGHDGRVHYHSIPNQEFMSAIDMVKRLIDLMPPAVDEGAAGYDQGEY